MRPLKFVLCAVALLTALVVMPNSHAQVSVTIGAPAVVIGGPPPVCPYGYFDYPPYACAPVGFYGPGYFYNGIFLGIGPWHYWGYRHGWGPHRFYGARGGYYVPGRYSHDHPYFADHPGHAYGHDYAHGHAEYHGGHEGHGEYHGGHDDHGHYDHGHH